MSSNINETETRTGIERYAQQSNKIYIHNIRRDNKTLPHRPSSSSLPFAPLLAPSHPPSTSSYSPCRPNQPTNQPLDSALLPACLPHSMAFKNTLRPNPIPADLTTLLPAYSFSSSAYKYPRYPSVHVLPKNQR